MPISPVDWIWYPDEGFYSSQCAQYYGSSRRFDQKGSKCIFPLWIWADNKAKKVRSLLRLIKHPVGLVFLHDTIMAEKLPVHSLFVFPRPVCNIAQRGFDPS